MSRGICPTNRGVRHGTSGHVWQGRFKSPVIQDDAHLLVVLRYIEANPLRAGMAADPADNRWSSFPHHGLGHAEPLVSAFPEWDELGGTEAERRRRWRAKVRGVQDEAELAAVRTSLRSGRPLGTDDWTGRMDKRLNIDLNPRSRGRPPKKKTDTNSDGAHEPIWKRSEQMDRIVVSG
jgi:putative transposase